MNKNLYSSTQRNQVYDWIERWFELTMLIIEVTGTDEPPFSAPPTELDEINYQRFRFLLLDHEAQFVQLWQEFYTCQEWAINKCEDDGSDMDELIKNRFSCCYKSENLYQLAQELDMQSGRDIWEPNEYRARTAFSMMIKMGERMLEF